MTDSAYEHIIEFSHVSKAFSDHQAVRDLHFGVRPRELVSIVGVTGCGKSTTFNLILGLVPPSEGQVRVNGRDPHADFDWFRRRIAVVFQDSRLLPWRTAVQNVHAGQRQRVALARAFSVDPDIILCDESFSALDEVTARALRQEFVDLVRGNGKTGVVITHSIAEALAIGNRVLVLRPPAHIADDIAVPADPGDRELADLRQRILAGMTPDAGTDVGTGAGAAGGAAGQPGADPARMMR
jgi:NitT/TauT family transport system ATP-binding protein